MSAAPRQPAPGRRSRLAKMRCGEDKQLFLSLASRKLASERPAAGCARSSVAAARSLRKPAREDSPCAERRSQNAAGRSNRPESRDETRCACRKSPVFPVVAAKPSVTFPGSRFGTALRWRAPRPCGNASFAEEGNPQAFRSSAQNRSPTTPCAHILLPGPSLDMILLLVHVLFRLYPRRRSSGTERVSCLKGMRTNDLERSANRRRG